MDTLYRADTAEVWLTAQIDNLMAFYKDKTKLSDVQVDELSAIIYQNYGFLRISELMFFFWSFKAGKYEKFYKAIDPSQIMDSLNKFVNETRVQAYIEQDQIINKEYKNARKPYLISEEEYLANKRQGAKSVFRKGADATTKTEEEVSLVLTEETYDSALALVNNRYNYPEDILSSFCEAWKKAHKVSPAEYIRLYNNK
ncbi:MAG: hypothetical protein AUK63_1969 [bacterium P3]|nr:MAG: hypothetical protein AUK63_1969 [bacterium P3]KWW34435.1 MAG: hypothetical protein F083_2466 [bacterium F083]